jgi:hypothetical protein
MEEATRTLFHDALSKSDNPATRALADVVTAAPEGRVACWGDLVAYVRDHFQRDDDSIALWQVLTAVGDRRPQLLFLDLHRARPTVLRSILADAAHVPSLVQCALVSMPEAEPLLANLPEGIAPAAREIAAGTPQIRVRERAVYEAHMGSLRVQRASAPYSPDAVLRHITEATQALRQIMNLAPIAPPVEVLPVPHVPIDIAQPTRPAPEVPPVVRPVVEAPPVPHVTTGAPEILRPAPEVAPVLRPVVVAEVAPVPRVITEAPQVLRPGGLP